MEIPILKSLQYLCQYALWLAGHNSTILTHHHLVSRFPELGLQKDDMKYPGYEPELVYMPKANVDDTISGQRTGISTLDHPATTPRVNNGCVLVLTMIITAW